MSILLVLLGALLALVAVSLLMSYWLSRLATLPQLELSRAFHGLILFGRDGSHVYLADPIKRNRIVFRKRLPANATWWLEVTISASEFPPGFEDEVERRFKLVAAGLQCEALGTGTDKSVKRFCLSGNGVWNQHLLEGIARSLVDCLGYEENARFRKGFEGPKDHERIREYFGFRR